MSEIVSNNSGSQPDPSKGEVTLISLDRFRRGIEGIASDVLSTQFGIVEPQLVDHLTTIHFEGIRTGVLLPTDPRDEVSKPESLKDALWLGELNFLFPTPDKYVRYQADLGRSVLYELSHSEHSSRVYVHSSKVGYNRADLTSHGKRCYVNAWSKSDGLEGFPTEMFRLISEEFTLCIDALKRIQKEVVEALGANAI